MNRLIVFPLVLRAPCLMAQDAATILLMGNKTGLRALGATNVASTSFTANWKLLSGGSSYTLDVSTDIAFGSFVGVYHDYAVTGTSQAVSGLSAATPYYYRLKCTKNTQTKTSTTVAVTTLEIPSLATISGAGANLVSANAANLLIR